VSVIATTNRSDLAHFTTTFNYLEERKKKKIHTEKKYINEIKKGKRKERKEKLLFVILSVAGKTFSRINPRLNGGSADVILAIFADPCSSACVSVLLFSLSLWRVVRDIRYCAARKIRRIEHRKPLNCASSRANKRGKRRMKGFEWKRSGEKNIDDDAPSSKLY